MDFKEYFVIALQTLRANKLRSTLTILGIVIGVWSVVFLISFGRGHEANLLAVFKTMGAETIYITSSSGNLAEALGSVSRRLTMDDAAALQNSSQGDAIGLVSPFIEKFSTVVYGNERATVDVMGIMPNVTEIIDYPIKSGVYITDADVLSGANIGVIGAVAAEHLFKDEDPLGKPVRIDGRTFEIVGLLEAKGGFVSSADDFIMIPITTMQAKLFGDTTTQGRPVQSIAVRAVTPDRVDEAKEQTISILRQRHHIREGEDNDFYVMDMREILKQMKQMMVIFQVFLASVGGISLLIGGIGIMNIMLVSVSERTREIGIRKAVGARKEDIIKQFLIESAMLSTSGGIIGIVLAFLTVMAVTGIEVGGYTVQAPFTPDIVIIALAMAVTIGMASGLYPAVRAANMDPVQSLRYQ